MADTTHGQSANTIERLADQCVMCGLCLPHCPTYRLDRHEAESPRGRIALARQIARGTLKPSAEAMAHLDHCLGCLSCQAVCPSGVRYEELLVQTRALLAPLRPSRGWLRPWLLRPGPLRRLARLVVALHADRWAPGMARLLPRRSLARRLVSEIPTAPRPLADPGRESGHRSGRARLILFPGCVARVFDRDTLAAGRQLLQALGYEVLVPEQDVCCGALALHGGDTAAALATARTTRAALKACDARNVLVSASGCLGSLRDHGSGSDTLQITDILGFLARDPDFGSLRFRPLVARAALHLPCTQTSIGEGGAPIRALLGRIPGLTLVEMPAQPRCCGAAGSYFLEQPERADLLRSERLDQIGVLAPDWLLTTNVGCRIFLGNGLRQRDSAVPVLHPLAMLARQLETDSP